MGEAAAVLRQVVGQIEELWDLYGSSPALYDSWLFLDAAHSSMEDDYCTLIIGRKPDMLTITEANTPPTNKRPRRELNIGSLIDSVSVDPMEQKIWKDFPEDLFEAVIARLPVDTFFRFRTVCKKWNSLLISSSFSQLCAEVPPSRPWFYTITHENVKGVAMYDPSLGKWHHPPNPFLPSKTFVLPVASVDGLICSLDVSNRNFSVCNPLTKSLRELPPRSSQVWSRVAVGMFLNGKTTADGYKVMWLGSNGDHGIYNSVLNSWTRPGTLPSSITLPLYLKFASQTVSVGNTLYFMRSNPDGILSYNATTDTWKQFIIPSPKHLTDRTLAECGGQIMLVGLQSKNAATCVCVWELQRMTLLWKEVDRMPNVSCLEFYGKHVRMTCLGNRNLLMLSLNSRRMNRLVTYDIMKREWQMVPDCLSPRGQRRQTIACGTAFYPCPTAFA